MNFNFNDRDLVILECIEANLLNIVDEQFEKDTRNFIHDILDSIRHGYDCMQYKESRDNIYERMVTKFKNYK